MRALALLALLPAAALAAEVDVSNLAGAQSETDIAIDPTNPTHVVGGSNSISLANGAQLFYESNNSGQSWVSSYLTIPNNFFFESDPALAFDRAGNLYYAYIAVDATATNLSLFVTTRPHGATTWSAPVRVPNVMSDKEFIVTDQNPASACVDSIYVAWDNNETATQTQTIRVSRSTNGGASFNSPPQVNTLGTTNIGAYPLIGPNGQVYVAWASYDDNTIRFSKSTDCGASWSPEAVIHTWTLPISGISYTPQSDPLRGISPMPWMAVDNSAGAHRGRIYTVYNDLGPTNSGVDVFLTYSDDEGTTWSPPVTLNDDTPGTGADQYFPRVAVDPGDSSVHVAFYDTRNDPQHLKTDVYHAASDDGAMTWLPNQKLTTQMSDETGTGADQNGYGDYIGIASVAGVVYPLWTENPTGANEDIYTASIFDVLAVATATLPNGVIGLPYGNSLVAGGGHPGYTWAVTGLPSSLAVTQATGAITGTPVVADLGPHSLNVTVHDSTNAMASAMVSLTVTYPPPVIDTPSLPDGNAGVAYSLQLSASSGLAPFTWTVTGMPASLTATPGGLITGTPLNSDAQTYVVTLSVTDGHGTRVTKQLALLIHPLGLSIPPAILPPGEENRTYPAYTFQANGGVAPYIWSWGFGFAPPPNLVLSANGTLSGTPTQGTAGMIRLQIQVTDSTQPTQQMATASFPLTIYSLPIANAGPDQTVQPGAVVHLDGTKSSDPRMRPLSFKWNAPNGVTLTGGDTATPTTSAIAMPGIYSFSLVVNTPDGATSVPSSVTITVTNTPPVISINAPTTAAQGSTVVLDASGTTDLDGDTLRFQWTETSGPDQSFALQTGPKAQFVPKASGTYLIDLEVNDGTNIVHGTASIQVTKHGCGCGTGDGAPALLAALLALARLARARKRAP